MGIKRSALGPEQKNVNEIADEYGVGGGNYGKSNASWSSFSAWHTKEKALNIKSSLKNSLGKGGTTRAQGSFLMTLCS